MADKKRILHIATALTWRGGEQQLAYLVQELNGQYEQFVLCTRGSAMEKFCLENNISVFRQRKRSGLDLFYAKRIQLICKNQKIDLCHLHDAHAHSFAILAADLFRNKCPLVLSRRVDFPIKNKWTSAHKYNHPAIAAILCVSQAIAEITGRGIKDKSKIKTVYSGIDLSKFSAKSGLLRRDLNLSDDVFLVGNTSALADHKDYFTFLDVAEQVLEASTNVKFIIFGDGPMKREIVDYAKSKKHAEDIIFTGFRDDIPQVLADLDLFFISSKTEGLGTSILDAFATMVPVVATAAGGIPELVENKKTGLLLEVGDRKGLSEAILSLIKDADLAKSLAQNAYEKVKQFTKEETARRTAGEYEKVFTSN